jgi:anti-anti-sigma factor
MTEGGGPVSDGYPEQQEGGSSSFTVQRLPGGIAIVRTRGVLDGDSSSQLCLIVAEELLQKPTQLVLDLSDLTSVDKAAVDSLVSASGLAAESDISFCLVAAHACPVVTTLAEAGLLERFEVFPTVRAATGNR